MKKTIPIVVATVLTLLTVNAGLLAVQSAFGHAGSPAATTWSSGQVLTAQNLNDTISHIHNTFSNGITDAHVNANAAIAISKLAVDIRILRAVGGTITACDCSQAAGTNCPSLFAGFGIATIQAAGTAGFCRINLNSSPTTTSFMVVVSPYNNGAATPAACMVDSTNSVAPHIFIRCYNSTTGAALNVPFAFSAYY